LVTNQEHFGAGVEVAAGVPAALASLIYDPQTSGGLLVAADSRLAGQVGRALESAGVAVFRVGEAVPAVGQSRVRVV
jgi:selenide,water dikinase